jgi:pimeloyl-ACP methyl ester carboxylesterase
VKPNNILSLLPVATIILIISSALPGPAAASDLAREQRLAEQTVDAILDGEPVMLTAGEHAFLGIYTEAVATPVRGAAIILHGRGMHPDWTQVAGPLRIELPEQGWSTLSLQMPVLAKDASYYDYEAVFPEAIPRINTGISYLRKQGIHRIVLIAHSCGVHMSMAWLKQQGSDDIAAYIGIGMGATDYRQPLRKPFPYGEIQVPLLHVYGSEDYPAVLRQADTLQAVLADINPQSAQIRITGADHYFDDYNEELVAAISGWLATLGK